MNGTDKLIRKPEVVRVTGLSPSTIWRMERAGQFPARRQVGPNSVAWKLSEVQAWIDGLPVASENHEVLSA